MMPFEARLPRPVRSKEGSVYGGQATGPDLANVPTLLHRRLFESSHLSPGIFRHVVNCVDPES